VRCQQLDPLKLRRFFDRFLFEFAEGVSGDETFEKVGPEKLPDSPETFVLGGVDALVPDEIAFFGTLPPDNDPLPVANPLGEPRALPGENRADGQYPDPSGFCDPDPDSVSHFGIRQLPAVAEGPGFPAAYPVGS
jgi:hypothetical protein